MTASLIARWKKGDNSVFMIHFTCLNIASYSTHAGCKMLMRCHCKKCFTDMKRCLKTEERIDSQRSNLFSAQETHTHAHTHTCAHTNKLREKLKFSSMKITFVTCATSSIFKLGILFRLPVILLNLLLTDVMIHY